MWFAFQFRHYEKFTTLYLRSWGQYSHYTDCVKYKSMGNIFSDSKTNENFEKLSLFSLFIANTILLKKNCETSCSVLVPVLVRTSFITPLEFFFQELSYSSLHSGRNLAWNRVCGDIDDPCGVIADFCEVIADFCGVIADLCGVVAIPEAIGIRRCGDVDRCATH